MEGNVVRDTAGIEALPVIVTYGDSVTTIHADGRIEAAGSGKPVAELLRRLRETNTPAARAASDPTVLAIAKLFGGRVDLVEPL
jgi:hypothetical protein